MKQAGEKRGHNDERNILWLCSIRNMLRVRLPGVPRSGSYRSWQGREVKGSLEQKIAKVFVILFVLPLPLIGLFTDPSAIVECYYNWEPSPDIAMNLFFTVLELASFAIVLMMIVDFAFFVGSLVNKVMCLICYKKVQVWSPEQEGK